MPRAGRNDLARTLSSGPGNSISPGRHATTKAPRDVGAVRGRTDAARRSTTGHGTRRTAVRMPTGRTPRVEPRGSNPAGRTPRVEPRGSNPAGRTPGERLD